MATLARAEGIILDVVTPEFDRMDDPPGRTVRARLRRILGIDARFDVLLVHRDAEAQPAQDRVVEIERAAEAEHVRWPKVPIVPIRMTEAWLLLDEADIRFVAGRPSGTDPLNLPPLASIESLPDPNHFSEASWRRRLGYEAAGSGNFSATSRLIGVSSLTASTWMGRLHNWTHGELSGKRQPSPCTRLTDRPDSKPISRNQPWT